MLEKLITEGGAVTPGTPLFVVSDLSTLWALAEIDETALPHVQTGAPVEVRVAAYPDRVVRRHDHVGGRHGEPEDASHHRAVRRCRTRRAGSSPTCTPPSCSARGEPRPIVVVPSQAVQDIDGKPVVFVETATGRFARRDVTVGADLGGQIEIKTGLRGRRARRRRPARSC